MITESIQQEFPEILPLESFRMAKGYSRAELSLAIDREYEAEGLAPPGIDAATLCRWEQGERRPNEERIAMLCRVYATRPDRLGFGEDHSPTPQGTIVPGVLASWPYTTLESDEDLRERIASARVSITTFGLTRNSYARDEILSLFTDRAQASVRIDMFVMDPYCPSRADRYRIEPAEAAMEDPARYKREVLVPLARAAEPHDTWRVWTYDFPVSFSIEQFDSVMRVMPYGHGKRGTEGPITVLDETSPMWPYYDSQVRWLHKLATTRAYEPWQSKGIHVRPLRPDPADI